MKQNKTKKRKTILYTPKEVKAMTFNAMAYGCEKVHENENWEKAHNIWWKKNKQFLTV